MRRRRRKEGEWERESPAAAGLGDVTATRHCGEELFMLSAERLCRHLTSDYYRLVRADSTECQLSLIVITSLPKVMWEEGCVAALSHTYAVKSPLVTMARPKFAPKSTSFRGPIPKPHYVPHAWTCPSYDAKRHPDAIGRFSTVHWTDRRTDRPTDRPRERLITIGRCAARATPPNNRSCHTRNAL